jgi:hypothetical protein
MKSVENAEHAEITEIAEKSDNVSKLFRVFRVLPSLQTDKFDLRNQLLDHFTTVDRRALHSSVMFVQRAEMIEAE